MGVVALHRRGYDESGNGIRLIRLLCGSMIVLFVLLVDVIGIIRVSCAIPGEGDAGIDTCIVILTPLSAIPSARRVLAAIAKRGVGVGQFCRSRTPELGV